MYMYMYQCTCTLLLAQWHSSIIVVSKGSKNILGNFMVEKFGEFLEISFLKF